MITASTEEMRRENCYCLALLPNQRRIDDVHPVLHVAAFAQAAQQCKRSATDDHLKQAARAILKVISESRETATTTAPSAR